MAEYAYRKWTFAENTTITLGAGGLGRIKIKKAIPHVRDGYI
jgi:hypothetical protein